MIQQISDFFGWLAEQIWSFIKLAVEAIVSLFQSLFDFLGLIVSTVFGWVGDILTFILDSIKERIWNALVYIWDSFIRQYYDSVVDTITDQVEELLQLIPNFPNVTTHLNYFVDAGVCWHVFTTCFTIYMSALAIKWIINLVAKFL